MKMLRQTICLMLVLVASSLSCRSGGTEPSRGPGWAMEVFGRDGEVLVEIQVEVVSSPDATTRGLMFRDEVPPGTGMLFVFPEEEVRSFWMRNTRVSLDIVFIDGTGEVVGIRRNTRPLSDESISVGVPSRYVLEVPAGYCSAQGIHRGARVALPF